MNPYQQWMKDSDGEVPAPGVRGIATGWMDLGTIPVTSGKLTVSDLWNWGEEAVVDVPSGDYIAQAQGVSFGAHKRPKALRVVLQGTTPSVGEPLDEISSDSWGMLIGDVTTWLDGLSDEAIQEFCGSLIGTYADGAEINKWAIGSKTARLAMSFTGLGSGGYTPHLLIADSKPVGVVVEFIEDDYVGQE